VCFVVFFKLLERERESLRVFFLLQIEEERRFAVRGYYIEEEREEQRSDLQKISTMAHPPSPLYIFKPRRLGLVAMAPPPSPSAMSLVKALLGLIRLIGVCGKPHLLQRRNASNIARRIELLAPLFEEIADLRIPVPPSAVLSFQELYTILSGVRVLLDDCREGSCFCLLMEQESVAQQFHDSTQNISVVLQALPLELLDLPVEVREQIELVRMQVLKSKPLLDPAELQLREEATALLGKVERKETLELFHLRKLFEKLQLLSVRDYEIEMQRLEDLRMEPRVSSKQQQDVVEKLTSFICFVRYGKCVLYGIPAAVKDGVVASKNSGTSSSSSTSANVVEVATIREADSAIVNPPEDFLCPINIDIMRDPVIVATGQTYERTAIARWLESGHHTCPKSGQKLPHLNVLPNYALRNVISQWCLENNVPFEKSDKKSSSTSKRRHEEKIANNGVALEATKLTAALLTQMLASASPEVQKQGAHELRLLTKCGTETRVCVAEAGAIPSLVPLLLSKDPKTQENAVTAMLNLSICECNKMPIMESGASEAIIEVLKAGSTMQARENAAATLFSLAVLDDLKVVIGSKPHVIPALVTLLLEGTPSRGKRDAATALYNLAVYKGNQASIVAAGAVPLLVSLLTDEEAAIADDALSVLAVIAGGSQEGVTAITETPAIPILVSVLRDGSSRGKEYAIVVLLALCRTGGDPVIKSLLKIPHAASLIYSLFTSGSTPRSKRKAGSLLRLLYKWKSAGNSSAGVH
jgi:hypothetical protein